MIIYDILGIMNMWKSSGYYSENVKNCYTYSVVSIKKL